jgi:hypothetical protein
MMEYVALNEYLSASHPHWALMAIEIAAKDPTIERN